MSTLVTPAEALNIFDKYGDAFLLNDALVANQAFVANGGYIYGNGSPTAGTGDQAFISALMNTNANVVATPLHISRNLSNIQSVFSAFQSWVSASSGSGASTIDGYWTAQNATPYSYLLAPANAAQYYLFNGGNPTTATTPTSGQLMSPANVFAPSLKFGAATVGASAAITYTDGLSIPTANNGWQTVTVTNATGGTFTLTLTAGGSTQTTAAIAYNAAASAVQTALTNLPNVGANQVLVTGSAGGPYTVVFYGSAFTNTLISTLVASGTSLTGTGATVTVTPTVNMTQVITLTSATGGTFTITAFGQTTGNIAYNATAATVQTALTGLSSIGAGNCTVTGSAGGPYTVTLTGILANQWFAPFTVNGANLTGAGATITVQQTALGSQQGWCPVKGLTCTATTTINGTCGITVTFDGWSSTGAVVTGRTATMTLDSLAAGSSVSTISFNNAGDRIRHITGITGTGTATAGAFTVNSTIERTPV